MASVDDRDDNIIESFGCHLSWTELRPVVADRQTLSREEGIIAREAEEWDFNDRPTYYTATRNLQGFIAYHLDKHDQALGFFQNVLDEDANNVNALGNLAFIHKKLCEIDEYKVYRKRLVCVLKEASYAERAMAYADKAFAIRHFEQFKRCFRYMRYIERAATIGRKYECPQRAEWIFDYALALYRRDIQMLYLRELAEVAAKEAARGAAKEADSVRENSECYSDERIREGFLKACQCFLEVAHTSISIDYQALSWVFLGILVNHDPENRSMAMAFPDEPELQHYTAAQCYEKGLDIHPEHYIVLRRVGSEYVKLGRFEEARPLLDKSLSKSPSQFGYRHRALLFLAKYKAEEDRRTEQATEWLQEAAKDFSEALKKKEFHADYSDLGYVYMLLGKNRMALVHFERATNSKQDDYFDTVLTHQRWAQCLERNHEVEGTRIQREEARQVRENILKTPLEEDQSDYFSDDLNHYSTKEKPGFVRILQDYHFWAAYSERRRYRYDFFVWHAERDIQWTVAFVNKLESEHGLLGSIQRRDFTAGMPISSEIMRCLRESYKFVIILTPPGESQDQDWLHTALNHAEIENNNKDRGGKYILPIKLRVCTLPNLLKPLTPLECEEGQIHKRHWDELVKNLSQPPISSNSS